jgi:two-component system response regulator PilR (NtrC family)
MKPLALVVDDEPDICELLSITLGRMDIATRTCGDVASARKVLSSEPIDLCLTDMRLPDGDGLELVEWMQSEVPATPVAVITAHGSVETAVRALKLGAFDFVSKPLDLNDLRKLVTAALKLKGTAAPRTESGDRLIGQSEAMGTLRQMISKVARSQAPVHISGESGTGKELVARMIHESGPRGDGPFVAINCGAIPTELMESEFFGHKKGSFTGAVADKTGLVETAEGGTLFLDEVADLPLNMQVKLLRVIQEKSIRPVGENVERPIDVRILSATHRDLARLVAEGSFREDLYYRINVIELKVPPLRDRGEDILLLAHHILLRNVGNDASLVPAMTPEAQHALLNYQFPGNVRELENILERASTLCTDEVIDIGDIQLRQAPELAEAAEASRPAAPKAQSVAAESPAADAGGTRLEEKLEDIERDAIVAALEETRYNKTKAAKLLGISFRALRYRIKKLNIE